MLDDPLDVSGACTRVRSWLARPQTALVHPGDRHAGVLFGLLDEAGSAGNLTTDAHLAALAVEHQAELHSTMPTWPGFVGCAGRTLSSDRRLPRCPSPASRLVEPENAGISPHGQDEGQTENDSDPPSAEDAPCRARKEMPQDNGDDARHDPWDRDREFVRSASD